ncbi:MAG: hypothetical protein V4520_05315 [Bacteroidota bacterium]
MDEDKIINEAHYVLMDADNSQQFPYNKDGLDSWCEILAKSVKAVHPSYFVTTEQPYLLAEALLYVLWGGFWDGDDAIVTTYYLFIKSCKDNLSPNAPFTNMLAFAFLDKHKDVIGKKVIENILQPSPNIDEIIAYQIIGQLYVLYCSFDKFNNEDYTSDYSIISWIDKAVAKYRDKFSATDESTKQKTINFVNENIDIMLENIEVYWQDLPEREDF